MSLTGQIRDLSSPLRRWMETIVDRARAAEAARGVNDLLAPIPPLRVASSDHATVAAALRLAMRGWAMVPPTPRPAPMSSEQAYAALAQPAFGAVRAGAEAAQARHRWEAAVEVAAGLLAMALTSRDNALRSRAYLALAAFVRVARDDTLPPLLAHAIVARPAAETIRAIVNATPMGAVADMVQILSTVRTVWGAELDADVAVAPILPGAALVGGADVDWIVRGTLWDVSASAAARPFGREDLLTGLAAALLDPYGEAGITALGWYFARHRQRHAVALADLLTRLDLPPAASLRERFWRDLSPHSRPLDPRTRAAVHEAPAALADALRAALPGIAGAMSRREVQIRAAPASGVWELVDPQGAIERLPNGWCVALTLQVNLQPALLIAVAAPDRPLRWTVARARAPREGRLSVVGLPFPLDDAHPAWKALIRGIRERLSQLQPEGS